jgi:hypothetical protein
VNDNSKPAESDGDWGEGDGDESDGPMTSYVLACLIVDELIDAKVVESVSFRAATKVVTKKLDAAKLSGEYERNRASSDEVNKTYPRTTQLAAVLVAALVEGNLVKAAVVDDVIDNRIMLGSY